jgi:hypothetical protein
LENSAEQITMAGDEILSVRPNPADVGSWIVANPAFPERIPPGFLAEQLKTLGLELFSREHLCVWDPMEGAGPALFGAGKWVACADPNRPGTVAPAALAVAVSFELTHGALAASGFDADGVAYPKPLRHGRGTAWLVAAAKAEQDKHNADVVIDGNGPAAVLIPDFEDAGVRLKITETGEVLDACAGIFDLVQEQQLRHGAWPELDAAVSAAVKRTVGDRWALGRRQSESDISVLEAVTLATWWAEHARVRLPAIF